MKKSSSNVKTAEPEASRGVPEIPDYELLRWIGGGAYGEVWLARSVTGSYRAVKVVWREDFELERTFEQEFEGIRHFEPVSRRHDGVVDVYHVGRNGNGKGKGFYYYVMELADDVVRGREIIPEKYIPKTLSQVMKEEGEMGWEVCRDTGVALSRALNHLHQNGLTHRDVKPANVIYVDGKPKLADIGLVATSGEMAYVGTDGYVPPEGAGTPEADVFSLGKVIYELSTGFDRMEFPAVPANRLGSAEADKWRKINEVVCKACTPVSDRRFPSAAAMAATLDVIGIETRPPSLIPAAASLVGFASVAMLAAMAWSGSGGGELEIAAPKAPAPQFVEVSIPPVPEVVVEPDPSTLLSTEDLEKQPGLKEVWKNSFGVDFDLNEKQHVSRHPIEVDLFKTYIKETERPFEGEVINIRDAAAEDGEPELVRHIVAVPPEDALEFCRWMADKDRSKGFLSAHHYYDIQRFEDYSHSVNEGVTGPKDPDNIAFRCVVGRRDYGAVAIESEPSGAEVYFREELVGTTPFEDPAVPTGRAQYEIRMEGYRVNEVSGLVKSGGSLELSAVLTSVRAASLDEKWKNGLAMDLVPVGDELLISAYEVRMREYRAFVEETGRKYEVGDYDGGDEHPAVCVNRKDAEDFCRWLTKKERKEGLIGDSLEYRLPTDTEWSTAVGLPLEKGESPASRNQKIQGVFPWGYAWPPPSGVANLADGSSDSKQPIPGYLDFAAYTAPVGSFQPNSKGIYDLSGNVWEWVSGDFGGEAEQFRDFAVVRGGSWVNSEKEKLLSSCRNAVPADLREPLYGFRPVLAKKK